MLWHKVEGLAEEFAKPECYPHLRLRVYDRYSNGAGCESELSMFHPEKGWTILACAVVNWECFRWNISKNEWELTETHVKDHYHWSCELPGESREAREERQKALKRAARADAHRQLHILAEYLYC